jgi:hypothetical protein
MTAGQSARDELVRFLDQEVFDPTLRAKRDPHSAADGPSRSTSGANDGARQRDDGGTTRPAGAERVRAMRRAARAAGVSDR